MHRCQSWKASSSPARSTHAQSAWSRKTRVHHVDHSRTCRQETGVTSAQLPDNVMNVLNTPGLETPEGVSPEKLMSITEAFWKAMRNTNGKAPQVVTQADTMLEHDAEFDVSICGGTLGIGLALALQKQGHSVCVVEKRKVEGRTQEWNISREDFSTFVALGLLEKEELEDCIATSWSKDRIVFHGESDKELWVTDALDLGIDPRKLISLLKRKFLDAGGTILEHTMFQKATVHPNGVSLKLLPLGHSSSEEHWTAGDINRPGKDDSDDDRRQKAIESLTCRLVVDCMGHYSPIVKQQRSGQPIEGVVIVVGGCMTGALQSTNNFADLLVTIDDSKDDMQYFWEAFPAEGGNAKTVYMFAYSDADQARPSFEHIFSKYLTELEQYQGISLEQVTFKRVLMGGFPCYSKNVPLKPGFDRIIQVGDASAVQSPLSFGGFASLCRHLPRLSRAINQALREDLLEKRNLAAINPYLPNLSVAWLFQRAMSLKIGQQKVQGKQGGWIPADHINRLMRCNFAVMSFFGPNVILPFIQDKFKAAALGVVMMGMMFKDPVTITRVLFQLGPKMIIMWMFHFICLVAYTLLHVLLSPLRNIAKGSYTLQRMLDAFEWGSGMDHVQAHDDNIEDNKQQLDAEYA